ncbi:thiamine phosphate synthase [Halochromatium sp.]
MLDLSVYLITDAALCARAGLVETVAAGLRGGVTVVQLRDKQVSDTELIEQGRALKGLLTGTGVPLIVNDRLEVALAIDADGVHLGQSDHSVAEAREVMGAEAILGLSLQSLDQLQRLDPTLVDYLGVGPVFATTTKPDHSSPLGFDGLAKICDASPLPVVAIGGLRAEHAGAVWSAGAEGMALVSAICAADNPEQSTRRIAEACRAARQGIVGPDVDLPSADADAEAGTDRQADASAPTGSNRVFRSAS